MDGLSFEVICNMVLGNSKSIIGRVSSINPVGWHLCVLYPGEARQAVFLLCCRSWQTRVQGTNLALFRPHLSTPFVHILSLDDFFPQWQWSSCNKLDSSKKAKNIYYLALNRGSSVTPVLKEPAVWWRNVSLTHDMSFLYTPSLSKSLERTHATSSVWRALSPFFIWPTPTHPLQLSSDATASHPTFTWQNPSPWRLAYPSPSSLTPPS